MTTAVATQTLNRQVKLHGTTNWLDFGDVTFEQAVEQFAQKKCLVDSVVDVRCESDPDQVRVLGVRRKIHYVVSGLRGEGSDA